MNRLKPLPNLKTTRTTPPVPRHPSKPVSANPFEGIPPHDADAEAGVLGSMMAGRSIANLVLATLAAEDFYVPMNQTVFKVFKDLIERQCDLDVVQVQAELKARNMIERIGPHFIGELMERVPNPANVERYCKIVKDHAAERNALGIASQIVRLAKSGGGQTIASKVRERVDALAQGEDAEVAGTNEIQSEIEAEISGARFSVDFPWDSLSQTLAFLPGTITVLCGSPGASKSLFILEAIWRMALASVPVSLLELEKNAAFHVRRAFAQIAGRSELTSPKWTKFNPVEQRRMIEESREVLDYLKQERVIQSPPQSEKPTCPYLLRWITAEAQRGVRVIAIDPITAMQGRDQRYLDQEEFINAASRIVQRYGVSLFLVTHPRSGAPGQAVKPHLDNMQGSKAFERFTDTCFWLESHATETTAIKTSMGVVNQNYNRTLHFIKVRLAAGSGTRVAFNLDYKSLTHVEVGKLTD